MSLALVAVALLIAAVAVYVIGSTIVDVLDAARSLGVGAGLAVLAVVLLFVAARGGRDE